MKTCTICHRELPDTEFYPSLLKKYDYKCKKCHQKRCKDYNNSIKNFVEEDFNRYYGGFNIKILNFARPNEYKFIIESTKETARPFYTNDLKEFMDKLWEELKPEK